MRLEDIVKERIVILDGEEFRLTHTQKGIREDVEWETPCNIWCFKRK